MRSAFIVARTLVDGDMDAASLTGSIIISSAMEQWGLQRGISA